MAQTPANPLSELEKFALELERLCFQIKNWYTLHSMFDQLSRFADVHQLSDLLEKSLSHSDRIKEAPSIRRQVFEDCKNSMIREITLARSKLSG